MLSDRDFGTLEITDLQGTRTYPAYTCGHCNDVVVVRPERQRERVRCLKCRKLLCEQRKECLGECLPLMEIIKDHFEGKAAQKFLPAYDAVMRRASPVDLLVKE